MLSYMTFISYMAFANLTACSGCDKTSEHMATNAPAAESDPNRQGNYKELAGEFPSSIDFIASGYGIDKIGRSLQRAWRMTDRAKAFRHVTTQIAELSSSNPDDLGLDQTKPIIFGLSVASKLALLRFPTTDGKKSENAIKAVIQELAPPSGSYALKAEGSALWLALGENMSDSSLTQILSQDKLSADDNFNKLAAKVPSSADFSYQISKATLDKYVVESGDRDLGLLVNLNLMPDSVFFSYNAKEKAVFKSYHAFAEGSFVSQLKTSSAKSTFLSHLPHEAALVFSSNLDLDSVFAALKEGKLGAEGTTLISAIEGNAAIKSQKETFIKGYGGSIVVTFAPASDRYLPIVPIAGIKTTDEEGYKGLVSSLCTEMSGSLQTFDSTAFCTNRDLAFGVWNSHLLITHPSYLTNLGRPGKSLSPAMEPVVKKSGLLTAAVDIDAMAEVLPEVPGMVRGLNGFPGALAFAASYEMMSDILPKVIMQSVHLNGNEVETELVIDADLGGLSFGALAIGMIAVIDEIEGAVDFL